MFDYVTLTQKGYTKAFEPVNELLTTLLQEMEGEVRIHLYSPQYTKQVPFTLRGPPLTPL